MTSEDDAPRRLAMFPLGTVLFPGGKLPLHVFEQRYRTMVLDCMSNDAGFGVVLIARGSEVGGKDQRYAVGTEAEIERATTFSDGRWALVAGGVRRIAVESWLAEDPYPAAAVRSLVAAGEEATHAAIEEAAALVRRATALLSELGTSVGGDPLGDLDVAADPERALWRLCDTAPLGPMDRQRLLQLDSDAERVSLLAELTNDATADLHRLLSEGGRS